MEDLLKNMLKKGGKISRVPFDITFSDIYELPPEKREAYEKKN